MILAKFQSRFNNGQPLIEWAVQGHELCKNTAWQGGYSSLVALFSDIILLEKFICHVW